MAEDFRGLKVWQEGLALLKEVYMIVVNFPKSEQYALKDQICRAANSIIANIAESQGRYHYADKVRVLYIARGETFEVMSHLSVALELKYIDNESFERLNRGYEVLFMKLSGLIKSIERKNG